MDQYIAQLSTLATTNLSLLAPLADDPEDAELEFTETTPGNVIHKFPTRAVSTSVGSHNVQIGNGSIAAGVIADTPKSVPSPPVAYTNTVLPPVTHLLPLTSPQSSMTDTTTTITTSDTPDIPSTTSPAMANPPPSSFWDTIPDLPPALAMNKGKTPDEIIADLKRSPLFMTDLNDLDPESDDLAALQALAYEGTALENAVHFKESGNEVFRVKRWLDAREFYGKGVAVLRGAEKARAVGEVPEARVVEVLEEEGDEESKKEEDDDPAQTIEEERALLSTLYLNRAACQLELQNYRACWLDCAACLSLLPPSLSTSLVPRNNININTKTTNTIASLSPQSPLTATPHQRQTATKAYYRSARALFLAHRLPEASDAASHGLSLDPTNSPLLTLSTTITKASNEAAHRRFAEERKKLARQSRARLVATALKARGIRTRSTVTKRENGDDEDGNGAVAANNNDDDDQKPRIALHPDPDSPESQLVFPTAILYPLVGESDFIQAFDETSCLGDQLSVMFPVPWDQARKEYFVGGSGGVECFMETSSGGLVRVGLKMTLLKVLGGGSGDGGKSQVEVVDGVVRIYVLPGGKSGDWIAEWKSRRGKK